MNLEIKLSLINPDEISNNSTPISNMPYDESFDFDNSDYVSSDNLEMSDDTIDIENLINDLSYNENSNKNFSEIKTKYDILTPEIIEQHDNIKNNDINCKIGDGKFEYITDEFTRDMIKNAWQAITLTEMWGFISQDIDNLSYSNDERFKLIFKKMEEIGYNGHSGFSFGCTIRNMQYIAKNGEDKFKELYI